MQQYIKDNSSLCPPKVHLSVQTTTLKAGFCLFSLNNQCRLKLLRRENAFCVFSVDSGDGNMMSCEHKLTFNQPNTVLALLTTGQIK